jgi:DNA-binding NtrC family response regulator
MTDLKLAGKTLLIVDDEAELRALLNNLFSLAGAEVLTADNGRCAFRVLEEKRVDAVISDVRMPEADGMELLGWIRKRDLKVPHVFLLTGFSDVTTEQAVEQGATALLQKPFDVRQLMQLVSNALNDTSAIPGVKAGNV